MVLKYEVDSPADQFTDTLKFNLEVNQSLSGEEVVALFLNM